MRQYSRIFNLWAFGLCFTLLNCGGEDGPSGPPEIPQNFTAVALDGQVMLTWTAEEGVTYNLFHSISAGLDVVSDAKVSDVDSPHTFSGLTNGNTYYYLLTAENSAGSSKPTEEISATPSPSPPVPQGFMAEVSNAQAILTWIAEEDVTYDLYHSTAAGFSLESGTKTANVSPPYPHTGLANDTTYYYRLTANNRFGASRPTAEISVIPYIVRGISAGSHYTCAVVNDGAKCWGQGVSGQLGNSVNSGANLPQQVTGLTSRVTQISAGENHTCALVNGGFWCWGLGPNGELGNRANRSANTPQQVRGRTSRTTHISVGKNHACAVMDGGAFCWGQGGSGQLGNSANSNQNAPVQAAGLNSGVTQISAGSAHTCAAVGGGAFCWGRGDHGRLGNNDNSDANAPVQVVDDMGTAISGVTQISAGENHTCAAVGGGAFCWGRGVNGELGNGANSNENTPVQVRGLTSGVTQISAGGTHTCAVAGGRAFCWGDDITGQLGNGGGSNANTPQQVDGLTSGVTQISAGRSHTCAVMNGVALCWGGGGNGQIGDGTEMQRSSPVAVRDLNK